MSPKRGFSLVEVLVALTIVGMAGRAFLLATQAANVATDDAMERTIAQGIAQQLIDECLGLPYHERGVSPSGPALGRDSGEDAAPLQRSLFDDTDDYHRYSSVAVRDPWGTKLGLGDGVGGTRHARFQLRNDFFDDWLVRIDVYYVDDADPSVNLTPPETSHYRAVEVQVGRNNASGAARWLAKLRRVFSYVPNPA